MSVKKTPTIVLTNEVYESVQQACARVVAWVREAGLSCPLRLAGEVLLHQPTGLVVRDFKRIDPTDHQESVTWQWLIPGPGFGNLGSLEWFLSLRSRLVDLVHYLNVLD